MAWRDDAMVAFDPNAKARECILYALSVMSLMKQIKPKQIGQPTCNPKTPAAYLQSVLRTHERCGVEVVSSKLVKNAVKGICTSTPRDMGLKLTFPDASSP